MANVILFMLGALLIVLGFALAFQAVRVLIHPLCTNGICCCTLYI